MIRKQNTIQQRGDALNDLTCVAPLPKAAVHLTTIEGFIDFYLRVENLYPTKKDAYEAVEVQHERIFGRRRYAEWKAFRVVQARYLRRARQRARPHFEC